MGKINKSLSSYKIILIIYLVFAIIASSQSYFQGKKDFVPGEKKYTHYNNYVIFKYSFFHLKNGKDLYKHHRDEYHDLYKYSPTFAVFFGAFAVLQDFIGLNLWNILNAFILLFAVYFLPFLNNKQKGLILIISLIELMTSMQNEQSNGLIAGLTILAFGLLEKKHYMLAAFCIVFSAFVKLFGIVALVMFAFYPQKWKLALYTFSWTIIFLFLPLIIVDFGYLKSMYLSWWDLLKMDHDTSYRYSIRGWLESWFHININKSIVPFAGAIILCTPLIRFKKYKDYYYRLLYLSSILIWMVIFNHKAESPTFIIAICGVSVWLVSQKTSNFNLILFWTAFIFTSLSPTDIFPSFLKDEYVKPYALKAAPCIFIWIKIMYELILDKYYPKTQEITIK